MVSPGKILLFIVGTRPEAIKLAPVICEAGRRGHFRALVCATAQHRGLLDSALATFGLKPDEDLDLMRPGQSLPDLTSRLFAALPPVLDRVRPAAVIVQGDTTTAFAAALSAFYAGVPVAHVEAGLRTGDPRAPFPEEINRRLVAQVARWHFAPTPAARGNLLREGFRASAVHVTGNTVIDALLQVAATNPALPAPLEPPPGSRLVLVTGHRRENFGKGLQSVCGALRDLAIRHPDLCLVYLVHPNPGVEGPVREILGGIPNIRLEPPADYPATVALLRRSHLVITDSGGIQEEAPALRVPVLVTRDATERPEAVEAGCAVLVGTDRDRIVREATRLITDPAARAAMVAGGSPFGDGKASGRILDILAAEI